MNGQALGFLMRIVSVIIIGAVMVIAVSSIAAIRVAKNYVDRTKLLDTIEKAITNGAALEDVKQIFENRLHVGRNIFEAFYWKEFANSSNSYQEPISLTMVLRDLRASVFLRENIDTKLTNQITMKLTEHESRNPFDKLEPNQRIHFEAVQSKLAENYARVQTDINRVVDELAAKNELVTKYLGDATLSFRISVVALVIGMVAFIPQLVSFWKWWKGKTVGGSNN